ncbi:hypothetical protein EW146_g802 [Bondarzewia mesenterica]|uniref:VWFA domain-containing protein n=1 Tax=Bondarzewia mesenterica TaxID=1095465 RepID=A0A4S4M6B9_9AGAM|nr:hypothetical protein EW146_g802 [Bondarzewia mesenterica]
MEYRTTQPRYGSPYPPAMLVSPGTYPQVNPYPSQKYSDYPPSVIIAPISATGENTYLIPRSPPFPSPVTPMTQSRTYSQWMVRAKEATAEFKRSGYPSPVAWVFVEGYNIPQNAMIAGDDRGRPLYIARTAYDGFHRLELGKAGRHLRLGASIPYNGREIDVASYEVLVEALMPVRWASQEATPVVEMPKVPEIRKDAVGSRASGLEQLRELKVVVIVDDSISMAGQPWNDAREALAGLAELHGKYNTDGLDIYFLNDLRCRVNLKDRNSVCDVFELVLPEGQTPTGKKLKEVFDIYIPRLEDRRIPYKPTIVLVVTDGVPSDNPKDVIVDAARRMDASGIPLRQLSIHFVQVGDDLSATQALKEIDNELIELRRIRDMVDTKLFNQHDPTFKTDSLVRTLMEAADRLLTAPQIFMPTTDRPTQWSYV